MGCALCDVSVIFFNGSLKLYDLLLTTSNGVWLTALVNELAALGTYIKAFELFTDGADGAGGGGRLSISGLAGAGGGILV